MLKPEQAEKRLKEFKTKNQQTARVAELAEPLRTWGYGLFGRNAEGKHPKEWDDRKRLREEATGALAKVTEAERLQVFAALFPRLAPHVESGWQLWTHLPYTEDYDAQPFRAPSRPELLASNRHEWLEALCNLLGDYEQDIEWVAAWTPHIAPYGVECLGVLLAGAIEAGGPEGEAVFRILLESGQNEHPIGAMGRHVTSALLCASRPDGWDWVERLLLAAQRQEGLRQTVLESIDEARPEAFQRMLRLIVQHDLQRFSATVRAVNAWFGFEFEVEHAKSVKALLAQVADLLESPEAVRQALASEDPRTVYLGLWSLAFGDVESVLEPARQLLRDPDAGRRMAAALLISRLDVPEVNPMLAPALEDPDLAVAFTAFWELMPEYGESPADAALRARMWEPLERLLERTPKKAPAIEVAWAGVTVEPDREQVAYQFTNCLGDRPARDLLPRLKDMDSSGRANAVNILAKQKKDPEVRQALLMMVGDPSAWVRERVLEALKKHRLTPSEAPELEKLLTRKADDLRRGVLTLLLSQKDPEALGSAQRLLAAKDASQRLGGLDLLRQMADAGRSASEVREAAAAFRAGRAPTAAEEELLAPLLGQESEAPTLANALGLMDPAARTPGTPPRETKVQLRTEPAWALVKSLDALVHAHRETPVKIKNWNDEEEEELLGNVRWQFPDPDAKLPAAEDAARLPLRELWQEWYDRRPAEMRDADGWELLRAITGLEIIKGVSAKNSEVVTPVLHWLLRLNPAPEGCVDFLLDGAEQCLFEIPEGVLKKAPKYAWDDGWREDEKRMVWVTLCRTHREYYPEQWRPEHIKRFWGLVRWMDEPGFDLPRSRPELEEVLAAHAAGAATEADLLDHLLARAEKDDDEDDYHDGFGSLSQESGRKPTALQAQYPVLGELVDRCRARILEVELTRGDLPTAASKAALALGYSGGAEVLLRLIQALGKGKLVRGYIYSNQGRSAIFSHLIRATHPGPEDTPERFAELARAAGVPEQRLIDAACYAPQWARHVERAVDWPQFAEAVWWIHAHTRDEQWSVAEEIREAWAAQVAELTPLTQERLMEGAVDVGWFRRIYSAFGPERWSRLDEAAKYCSSAGGHKRAQLFADAMLGRLQREDLVTGIREKRSQDSLRALGLLPLPDGPEREAEVLARYQVIQEFLRGSKQFGAQKQTSEKLAAGIAMENLARTAGYADPVRLEWAMEAREIQDLAQGPVTVTAGDVTLTLSINDWGEPDLALAKAGKPLKSVPAAVKKDPTITALQERKREVQRQAARMRLSLEAAMCRGDELEAAEIASLMGHPVLAPMLRNLVLAAEGTVGYPVDEGRALEDHSGRTRPVPARVRVAHPHDLFHTGEWHLWQSDCFRRERIQPFKQVFRELYVRTEAETSDQVRSQRYAGHQVNPTQARALLGKRGWVSNPEEGDVRRTFFHENITAWVEFDYGYTTPAEVEGLTLDHVAFSRRGEWEPLPLEQVPPRVFSEVMRDVDLVVSVAHQGGVDPEATASTVEMRAALLRETCGLLKLANVRLQDSHALVDGQLGTYSIHLGSAVVHRQPGGHLCIVPVHSQHRGRIFLPFADPDPRTAEVVSKVLLLARDHEIQDPTILEQIRG